MKEYDHLGDYEIHTDVGKQFEVNECNAFMQDLRQDGYKVFSSDKFCRQTKGANVWRITQFNQDALVAAAADQYRFYDNLNDIIFKTACDHGKQGVFDDSSIVIQK